MVKDEPTQKHTLHLYEGDFERLNDLYPDVPASLIIRQLIRAHIAKAEQSINLKKVGKVTL